MSTTESEVNNESLDELPEIKTPPIKSAPGTMDAALEVLRNQLKAYEDSILTLQAKRNHINASIKHRRAQAQAVADTLRKLEKTTNQ